MIFSVSRMGVHISLEGYLWSVCNRDSNPQMRGVKVYGGQPVKAGGIIVRQLGTKVS